MKNSGPTFLGTDEIAKSIAFGGVSALCMEGAGYLVASGGLRHEVIAVLLVLLWVITLTSGLN